MKIMSKFSYKAESLYKRKAILYGNCHMNVIEECLNKSKSFRKRYQIVKIPLFYEGEGPINKKILSKCSLFIYQDIREQNQYGVEYSSGHLLQQLPQSCIRICVPNLYELGYGFFPQNLVRQQQPKFFNKNNPSFAGDNRGLFVHGDKVIQDLLEKGVGVDSIVDMVQYGNVIDEEYILANFNKYWNKIRDREKSWDIKIYDFLRSNYKEKQIFSDFGHPTSIVLKYMSELVLERLNICDDIVDIEVESVLDEFEDPIYPCVKRVLGLQYQKKYLREHSNKKIQNEMDLEEYIREYCYWCHPRKEQV